MKKPSKQISHTNREKRDGITMREREKFNNNCWHIKFVRHFTQKLVLFTTGKCKEKKYFKYTYAALSTVINYSLGIYVENLVTIGS